MTKVNQRRLSSLAYPKLGCLIDAKGIVQEAYLKWHSSQPLNIDNPDTSRTAAGTGYAGTNNAPAWSTLMLPMAAVAELRTILAADRI